MVPIPGAFTYLIEFRTTRQHYNCDGLSRLPVLGDATPEPDEEKLFYTELLQVLPTTDKEIRSISRQDSTISTVLDAVQNGWEEPNPQPELQPFFNRRNELTTHQGVLLWGNRVVIPSKLQGQVLQTRRTHRDNENEGFSPQLRLVAEHGSRHRTNNTSM